MEEIEDLDLEGGDDTTQSEEELHALLEVVDELIAEGKLGRSVDILDGAERRFSADKESQLYVKFLLKKAQLFVTRARWNEARDYFDIAAEIVNRHENESVEWKKFAQEIYLGIGKMSWRLGDYELAEDFIVRAISYSEQDDLKVGKGYIELGNIKGEKGDMEASIENYRKAIGVLEKIGEKDELTRALNNISDSYYKMDNFEKSVEYADKCIALAKEIGNQRYLGFGYMTGGEALIKMGEVEKSKEYFQNSQDIFWDTDDAYVHGCLFTLLGMIDTEVDSYKEAREAFEKARDYLEQTDIRYYLARVYHEYGTLEEKQGHYSDAKDLYEKSLDILTHDKCLQEAQEVQQHLKKMKEREEKEEE